jgi:hypothetical protein
MPLSLKFTTLFLETKGAYADRKVKAASANRRPTKFALAKGQCKTPVGRQLLGSLECLEDRLARIKSR